VGVPPAGTKGERTRARLVEVAAQVFDDRGYAAATFGELIQAAGVSKGAFYFHFTSKEQLALAVLEQTKGRWLAGVQARLADAPDAVTALRALAPALLDLHAQDPIGWTATGLGRELSSSPPLRQRAAAVTRAWIELIGGLVERAQGEGGVRAELDPYAVARLLVGVVDGAHAVADALEEPDARRGAFAVQLDLLLELLERGLFVDGTPRR
jgi:AcrR family transcriptional regulator